jgi:hypothetical protein
MRALVLLCCASGCLIEAPEGASQLWPPPLGLTVQAVTAGDLDGTGSTDIVVFGTGNENQAGMYVIKGGVDIAPGTGKPVRSFSTFVPRDLTTRMAATITPGSVPRVFTATGTAAATLTSFSNALAEEDQAATTIATNGALLWLRSIVFPGAQQRLVLGNGSYIEHASLDLSEVRAIPAPAGPTWNLAQLASSYASGTSQVAVVATPTEVLRAPIPTGGGTPTFNWTQVRQGASWLGQTSVDLDGDGREEIVGFDIATHAICVVDPGTASVPATPVCLPVNSTFGGTEVTIIAGVNVTMNPGLDIVIAQATEMDTSFTLVEDYTYSAGALTAPTSHPLGMGGPAHGRTIVVSGGPGTPNTVLVFGTDGAVGCLLGPC